MGNEKFDLKFHYASFKISKFEMSEYIPIDEDEKVTNFNIVSQFSLDIKRSIFHVDVKVKCSYKDQDDKDNEFCRFESQSQFVIKDLANTIDRTEDGKVFFKSDDVSAVFLGISYSTTRGALATKASGTILESQLLPVIEPRSLIDSRPEFI